MEGPVYVQRPSKAVTRLVLVEMLERLRHIEELPKYQYVGFGALEFVDFDLVHRRLGITRMISIEKSTKAVVRQCANRPYNGIEVLPGDAQTVLPGIDWTALSIVWLDYTQGLNIPIIATVQDLCRRLKPGSVLAVTLNAEPFRPKDGRLADLQNKVGPERVPERVTDNTLGAWGTAQTQRRILDAVIRSEVADRPGGEDTWHQLLNIEYSDGAYMQVVAGIVGGPGMDQAIAGCLFDKVATYRPDAGTLRVQVPYLTPKERRSLNERLPRKPRHRLALPGVSADEVRAYEEAYRWLEPTA